MTKTFFSHARGDDEPFATRWQDDLTKASFEMWLDREDIPNPALPFPLEIQNDIERRYRLVFVAGPKAALSSEWCAYRVAAGVAVNAVSKTLPVSPMLALSQHVKQAILVGS